jgi:hypothetical protein
MRARLAILLAGTVALGGCAYGYGGYGPYGGLSVGVGYGSGYGGYGGYGGCYDPYSAAGGYGGYDYYGFPTGGYGYGSCGYGGGYGAYGSSPYFGWYGDYYYPGTGYYVYDRYRRPHVWSDRQRRYWSNRREHWQRTDRDHDRWQRNDRNHDRATSSRAVVRENWSGFERPQRAQSRSDSNRRTETRRTQRSDSVRPQ